MPDATPDNNGIAGLVLELQDPNVTEEKDATDKVLRRARARAVLRYLPPPR